MYLLDYEYNFSVLNENLMILLIKLLIAYVDIEKAYYEKSVGS